MKNLIFQVNVDTKKYKDPTYNNLAPSEIDKYSYLSFKIYAEKYAHDFVQVTEPVLDCKHPTWERFDLWLNPAWFEKYDQIMYVDSDVVVVPGAQDIFKMYPDLETFKFARYERYRSMPLDIHRETNQNTIFKNIDPATIQQRRFQTGVFILTKHSAQVMLPYIKDYVNCEVDDGQFLNWAVMASGVECTEMDYKFNVKNNGRYRKDKIYFMHCSGGKKHKKASTIWKLMKEYYPSVNVNFSALLD